MTASPLTIHLHRAGISSVRELSELTGIPKSSIDRILHRPEIARVYQLEAIAQVSGMSVEDVGKLVLKKEEMNGTNKEGNKTRA